MAFAQNPAVKEALQKEGKLHAIQLKRASGMYGDENKTRFDRALTELQTGLKVMPVGVAQAGAWHYAFIYEIVSRHLPEECAAAQALTRPQARDMILARHMKNVIQATPQELKKVFGKILI
ncbi:MAG TPA: hypothetical protein PL074_10875, partial [Thermoflexales bacterium]|nr:hypothetical protein [Thermoflexales bacterium]